MSQTSAVWGCGHIQCPTWSLSKCYATRVHIIKLPGGYGKAERWRQHIKGQAQFKAVCNFRAVKSKRTEAENRATGGHFLFSLSRPMQAFLLTIDDRWLLVSHPGSLFSCSFLDFNLSFLCTQFFFPLSFFFSASLSVYSCVFQIFFPPPVLHSCLVSHLSQHHPLKFEYHPCNRARAAQDAAVSTRREEPQTDMEGESET